MTWYCYILRSGNPVYSSQTYNGSTNDLVRRLRQHNGEIVGGAKATRNKGPWEYYAIFTGFETHNETLSCEWRIKHPTGQRQRPKKYSGVNGRIDSFNLILNLENWSTKCEGLCTEKIYTLYLAPDVFNIITNNNIKHNVQIKELNELIY